jgi:hypothetical protein
MGRKGNTGYEDWGLMRFGEDFKKDPERTGFVVEHFEGKLAAAQDSQPVNAHVRQLLEDAAAKAKELHGLSEQLHKAFRDGNDADVERNEAPRRGEQNADYGKNRRDG